MSKLVLSITLLAPTFVFSQSHVDMSDAAIEQLQETLSGTIVTQGKFEQTRQISGIPRALKSNGRFIFWLNHGIFWQTDQPFFSAVTFTTQDAIQWNSDLTPMPNDDRQNIVQKYMNDVIFAIFQADSDGLKRYFHQEWRGETESWSLVLRPSNSTVGKAINHIELRGDEFVRSVKIFSTEGDSTTVEFSDLRSSERLNAEDCRFFYRDTVPHCQVGSNAFH